MSNQSIAGGGCGLHSRDRLLGNPPGIDLKRIAIMGRSFGGYWAAKMAYVEAKRLRAAVVWGGGVHYFFQADWLRESTNADSYLMDHDIARCRLFGVDSVEELIEPWAALSLKDQGWLEKSSCSMLIVNGKNDLQTPLADLYILLEYGTPKSARVFPAVTWAKPRKPFRRSRIG